jgi:hypothetical protein
MPHSNIFARVLNTVNNITKTKLNTIDFNGGIKLYG